MKTFGHFDDVSRAYCITEPVTPRPWINYIGNGRLAAFISQNAGGLLWLHEPYTRRLTRYHFIPAPGDRPGFYLYVRNRNTQSVWNPHFAPTCSALDRFECRHSPGLSVFTGEKANVRIEVSYGIPPNDDVMLWRVKATNLGASPVQIELASYMEFGLLEFMRETLGWCYLKNHFGLTFDAATRSIRYDYHVFEAPACPAMAFACTDEVSRFECSRDAFVGRTGSLERPDSLTPGNDLSNSEIPGGGHACATLGIDLDLAPGEAREFGYCFAVADSWPLADALLKKYSRVEAINAGLSEISSHWDARFRALQVQTGVSALDRFVNTWNPCNAVVALENCRIISTDHTGVDGLRYRDTSQDALAVTHLDTTMALSRLRLVLAQQTKDGGGCFAFYPETARPTSDTPHRSDNTVWPVYTFWHLIAETGDASVLDEVIPFRDGDEASVYEHLKLGLEHIYQRRGQNGLPTMFHADWNDGLALFGDEAAESVMLGMQLVAACRDFRDLALLAGRANDVAWCEAVADELGAILNSEKSWDGQWYRRLLLSNGKVVGTAASAQGQIYLDVQPWAVLSGVGDFQGRGALALESLHERLNTEFGLSIVAPPYRGFPEPGDKPMGSNPGTNENGGVFCHANTWAIIAECLLGNSERAFEYYVKLLPEEVINKVGAAHYEREPYAYVSTLLGPGSDAQGRAGISWLTGTASWMYVAVTQYILGIRPTLEGLLIRPCLPKSISEVRVTRQWRGVEYVIDIRHSGSGKNEVRIDGEILPGSFIKPGRSGRVSVQCFC